MTHFPACFVEMPPCAENRRATFYLAAEEFIAQTLPQDDYLFSWQLAPTVVMGRNQTAHTEVNLPFCHREGIDVVRRKSGGGAIYADRGNIMWSLITGAGAVEGIFKEYASAVANALCALGAQAEVTGRNDIHLACGGKICGNAFYHLPDRNIAHGTMLYDTDTRLMQNALSPPAVKLQAKGVKSVQSRIALLKDVLPIGTDELRTRLRPLLCNRTIHLSIKDVEQIERMSSEYDRPEYLYGNAGESDVEYNGHIEGVGMLSLAFQLCGSLITDVTPSGDFFELSDSHTAFRQAFKGKLYSSDALRAAIGEYHPERSIRHLSAPALCALLRL